MLASVSQTIRKAGLNTTHGPVIASTITTATSLLCLLGSLLFSGKTRAIKIDRQSPPFYSAAAVFALIAQLCTFVTLNGAQISVVAPLINTTPLFAIAFTALFCAAKKKITPMVLIGVVLLVAGIGFITARWLSAGFHVKSMMLLSTA
jgi:uncharacterized membrane protein